MHTYSKMILMFSLSAATFGCKSFEKMKGTLVKSEDKSEISGTTTQLANEPVSMDSRNSTWISPDSSEVITDLAPSTKSPARTSVPSDSVRHPQKSYARNYDLSMDGESSSSVSPIDGSLAAYNQKMVDQYKEMDQLAEVVLYEINVIDKTWSQYAQQYKRASANERDQLSRELSRLDDQKLLLYKTYTRIYKQGKTDWESVKQDVEKNLLSVRGLK
ncbi:hypothetical protein [Dyadobacter tibetensis]|uniref:hypothetical protein n=1 Tax=Dyadobacter tibetensis TaxID=1211851 RepID=UPI00046EF7DE|nr:hypothetical protein [Dyadobacter tibetensis]